MVTFNDQFREMFVSQIENITISEYLPQTDAIKKYIGDVFYAICEISTPYERIYKMYMESLIYLDAYKIYSYKQKKGISNDYEKELFCNLLELEDYTDISSEYEANPEFLFKCIEAALEFMKMDELSRIMVVRSLSFKERVDILKKVSLHEQDDSYYNRPVLPKQLIENYNYRKKYYQNVMSINFPQGLLMHLAGFLTEFYRTSKENARMIAIKIVRDDYLVAKFLENKVDDDIFKGHIKFYVENNLEDILALFFQNQDFMMKALESFIALNAEFKYGDIDLNKNVLIDEDEVLAKLIKKL